jgi:hypothetical protein
MASSELHWYSSVFLSHSVVDLHHVVPWDCLIDFGELLAQLLSKALFL